MTRESVTRYVAWALVAGYLLMIGTMLVAGARVTPYDELVGRIADGQVDEVRVAGGFEDGHGRGFALAEVHWRDRLIPRVSPVYETTGRPESTGLSYDQEPRVRGYVDEHLRGMDPDLRTSRAGELGQGQFEIRIWFGAKPDASGWQVPGWSVFLGFALFLGTLGVLILGPEPRRATRWAWFWLLGVAAPLGALAFLTLGGAASRRPQPVQTEGRLRGGWALFWALLLNLAISGLLVVAL